MKICWDTLETVSLTWNGNFRKNSDMYVEMNACKICGGPYLTVKSRQSDFCSKSCGKMFKKKGPMSDEQKIKISNGIRGEKHPFYGKHLSEKHIQNLSKPKTEKHKKSLSIAAKKRLKIKENHPNWKGGVKRKNIPLYDTYAHQIDYAEEVRRDIEYPDRLQVRCVYCNKWYTPKTTEVHGRLRVLNGNGNGEQRFYCSNNCKIACPIYHAIKWPKGFKKVSSREVNPYLRQICFERDNWTCQICGKTAKEAQLHCHHIDPVTQNPMFQNDIDSVITLCKKCHKFVHTLPGCNYHELKCENHDKKIIEKEKKRLNPD